MKENKNKKEFLNAYDKYSEAIFRHSLFRVSDREVALDIVQESFLKTWQHIERGNDIVNMRAFLYKVTSNLIIDYYRKHKSASLDNLLEEGFDPKSSDHENISATGELNLILRAVDKLPENEKTVVTMRYVDGFSVGEIAGLLEESENVISVRLHRALKKLKGIIKP